MLYSHPALYLHTASQQVALQVPLQLTKAVQLDCMERRHVH